MEAYAEPNLARTTLELYAMLWDAHVLPRLGGLALRDVTPETIQRFQVELQADGVGVVSARKALTLLHGVLQRACEWGRLPSNPAAAVRKPPVRRQRAVTPLSPTIVERIRDVVLADGRLRDATLVSVLAYAGLRPGEALALTWGTSAAAHSWSRLRSRSASCATRRQGSAGRSCSFPRSRRT